MGDSSPMAGSSTNYSFATKKMTGRGLVESSEEFVSRKAVERSRVVPKKHLRARGVVSPGQIAMFFLKVAALETIRRLSRARCPVVWRAVQALHVLSFPPFRWIRRWVPVGAMIKGVQEISRPLLFLSIATAFPNHSENSSKMPDTVDDSQTLSNLSSSKSSPDVRSSDVSSENIGSENWLLQLLEELQKQGIVLPERFDDKELQRFYIAANGDFSCLLSSLKKTIHWRESYSLLSSQELEMWSHLVFWHGSDIKLRPCLIIRLGLACSSLMHRDRPRFAQAVVSQIENGVLHLASGEDPRITVVMDCEGLTPFRFPMKLLRSCTTLVQDHYPSRLGSLFVIRLPPVVRVIAQTFIQVLKPSVKQKLRVEGEAYQKVLSELLQAVPAFLGGDCTCLKCLILRVGKSRGSTEETTTHHPSQKASADESSQHRPPIAEGPVNVSDDHVLRSAIGAIIMLWIFVAFLAGMHDPESLQSIGF